MRLYRCDICDTEYERGGSVRFDTTGRDIGGGLVWADSTADWPLRDTDADICPECAAIAARALTKRYREVNDD